MQSVLSKCPGYHEYLVISDLFILDGFNIITPIRASGARIFPVYLEFLVMLSLGIMSIHCIEFIRKSDKFLINLNETKRNEITFVSMTAIV